MKKLRFFDSLKFVLATVACMFILNVAHADTNTIQSVIAYGKTEQSATPTPTNPVPIMTNNGVLKVNKNLLNPATVGVGFIKENGTLSISSDSGHSSSRYSDLIPVVKGLSYTFSGNASVGKKRVHGYDANSNWVQMLNEKGVSSQTRYILTTAIPNNVKFIRVSYSSSDTDVKVTEGTSANEIYTDGLTETIRDSAGHTATAEMLLGINDTYRDEQNINTGAITRRVGVKVFDGSENWYLVNSTQNNVYDVMRTDLSSVAPDAKVEQLAVKCTHLERRGVTAFNGDVSGFAWATKWFDSTPRVAIRVAGITTVAQFKQWLAEQYAAGTPVIVVYPLATETTENVATQQMTTAPVRQTAGSILGMPIEVVLGDGTREWVRDMITIATTRYNEEQFAPVETRLDAAVAAVDTVVTQTMSQAQQIDQIATNKQTRPDETCPPFKKCLLVEDEDGTPHWYEIYDPINDFLRPILASAGLSGNRGAPTQTTHTSGSNTIYDTYNGFYKTNNIFKNQYVSGTVGAQNRPFGPTTLPRCDDNATRNTMPTNAGICYNTGGMFRDLTDGPADDAGEWAVVYNGNEGGTSLGITPGVVYGVAKCTSVGQHTTQMTGDVADGSNYWWPKKLTEYSNTTLSSLIEQYPNVVDVFNTLPNPVGTDEKPGYPRENFRNCWCKMTAIGIPGAGDDFTAQAANGTIMSVSGDWVFDRVIGDLNSCVGQCAYYCTSLVMLLSKSRKAVFTAK